MTPYVVVFIVLLLFVLLDFSANPWKKLSGFCASYMLLVLFIGLRDQTGTDWQYYFEHYEHLRSAGRSLSYSFDIGYEVLAHAFALVGTSYNAFVFFYTATYLAFFYAAFRHLPNGHLAVLIFYSTYLVAFMGTSRQMMALGISTLAFFKLRDQRHLQFLGLVLLAAAFHKSALLMLLGLLFPRSGALFPVKVVLALALVLAVSLLDANLLFGLILQVASFSEVFVSKLMDYVVMDDQLPIFFTEDRTVVALLYLKRILIVGLLFFLASANPAEKTIRLAFQYYVAGFLVFASLYSILPAVAIRLSLVFTFFEVLAFSSIRFVRRGAVVLVLFLLLFVPERMVAMLTGVDSDLLIPYKGYLFERHVEREPR